MSQIKIPLIVFSAVFVVSGILSFVGGSSYLAIIFKAGVSAVIVIAFFFIAKVLLEKYVPDMFENPDKIDMPDAPMVGTAVDVRIGGADGDANVGNAEEVISQSVSDKDLSESSLDGLSDDRLTESDPLVDVELDPPDFKPMSFKKEENTGKIQENEKNIVSEIKPEVQAEESIRVPNPKQEAETITSENSGNQSVSVGATVAVGSGTSVDDAKLSEAEMSMAIEKDVDRLEELPDLREFVDSSGIPVQSKGEELMSQGTQSFFETDLSGDSTDSKLMANAIRTVLRRE